MQRFLLAAWRPAIAVVTLGLLAYLLYFHRLGNLLPGYNSLETHTYESAGSWRNLLDNPLNAPYKLVLLLASSLGYHQIVITRLTAAACGLLAVVVFFLIARTWYGFRVGLLGTILFASSSGLLHFARLGSPQIVEMGVIALIGMVLWHRRSPQLHPYLTYLAVVLFAVLLYVPGMVWFELFTVVLLYKRILQHWSNAAMPARIAWPGIVLLIVAPFAFSIVRQPHLLMTALGLPTSLHNLTNMGTNLLHNILSIGVRSTGDPVLWLAHSPLLNVTELILGAIGVYYYVYQRRSLRSLLLAGSALIGITLASIGGGFTIAAIIPIIYLFITSGLHHLLNEWLTVFPRNPIARFTGVFIICGMLFFSGFYHVRSYFVAWPHNTAAKQAFSLHRP